MSLGFKVLKAFKSRGYKVLDIADEVSDSEIAGIIEIKEIRKMKNWSRKEEWRLHGKGFVVTVTRHEEKTELQHGPNRWAVYAYIYNTHPSFLDFEGSSMFQNATEKMPLHCGCSFLQYHKRENGDIGSVQVGADYNHLGDEQFTHMATIADAHAVFSNAEELFDYLSPEI